ncbi:hypothetical protein K505DRAFT_227211 [Melanomma pulvis-pyrius CBS 109.77]|uniref:Protein disulfide-isomerase n=1 Tax=Melanomma pulvis-pyrius CBS 109.77 TaxID=1314802 RepID=A0A6A6XXS8_9PLEO|nr:hypothetical protein K505DRAFT_227211 [Melanomma pulvis-pyrius CBS 109.77]
MYFSTLVCLFASCFVLSAARLIEDISSAGFGALLSEHEILLAAFTSRTFEALSPFHDIFEQAADTVKTPFVIVDCEQELELCREFDVNAYPAIKLFKRKKDADKDGNESENENGEGGEIIRYRGRKMKHAIRSFVTKHEVPVLTHVQPSALADLKKIDDVVIIAYLRPDQEALLEIFRAIAKNHHQNFVFGYSTDMPTADAEGLAMPAIVCYKNSDGDNKVMNGHFKEEDVETFLRTAARDVIGEFNERTMDSFMAPGKLAAYIFAATEEDQIALRRELTPIAKRFEKFVTFGVADAVEYAPMAQNFGLLEDRYPALVVHAPMNDNVFAYRQGRQIQASTVEAMLTTILQAKATSGQVFGDDAPEMVEPKEEDDAKGHDEL